MIHVSMTNKTGIILTTAGKFCDEHVMVSPVLQEPSFTVSRNGTSEFSVDSGYCGMSKVRVFVDVPMHELFPNAEGVKF